MAKETEQAEPDKALDGSKTVSPPTPAGELSEEQLDAVSGGRGRFVYDPAKAAPDVDYS